jgi:hypothetical protein
MIQVLVDKSPMSAVWRSKCCRAKVEIQFRTVNVFDNEEKADFYCTACERQCEPEILPSLRDEDRSRKTT